jgi:hypothetical protein
MFLIKSTAPTDFEHTNFNYPHLGPIELGPTDFELIDLDHSPKSNLMLLAPTVKSTLCPRIFYFGGLTTGSEMKS